MNDNTDSIKYIKEKLKNSNKPNYDEEDEKDKGYENSPYKKREKRTTLPNVNKIPAQYTKGDSKKDLYNQNSDKNINNNYNSPIHRISEYSSQGGSKTGTKNNFFNNKPPTGMSPLINLKGEVSPLLKTKDNVLKNMMPFSLDDEEKIKFKLKTSFKSKAGNNGGHPKTNQDSCLCKLSGLKKEGFNLYAVMDGHGSHGHFISNSVKSLFGEYMFKPTHFDPHPTLASISKKLHDKDYEIFKKCFQHCETTLAKSKYEVNFSGTTAVMVAQVDDCLICANTGDSRAILCTSEGIKNLSIDHKPDSEGERERIIANGGRVEKFNDNGEFIGPYRVWLKHEDYPGLAMSRSLGDFVSKSVGCSCVPQVIEAKLDETCQFLVIASDGVWEFLNNQTVCKLVEPYYLKQDPDGACNKVIEESARMWKIVSSKNNYLNRKMMVKMI